MKAELETHWKRCGKYLQPALDHAGNLFSLDDVWLCVATGEAQFWPGTAAAAVTEIKVYPRKKVLNVWLAGGDMQELFRMAPYFKQFGKDNHCELITISGRPGWAKVFGKKPAAVTISEQL